MKTEKIRKILKRFKIFCKRRGWEISENDDWVKIEEEYHNFIWIRNIHPSSFQKITANGKCVVREGLSYRVAKTSYTAWLFCETPPEILLETISENSEFLAKTAIYDLEHVLGGKRLVYKYNFTDSTVFENFENFLKEELKIKIKPILESEMSSEKPEVAQVA
ncbi:MAG: hypothetical protein PVH12_08240 [Candidatus Bathyarchaeota archaeon]|jgi:hypothetical protein